MMMMMLMLMMVVDFMEPSMLSLSLSLFVFLINQEPVDGGQMANPRPVLHYLLLCIACTYPYIG